MPLRSQLSLLPGCRQNVIQNLILSIQGSGENISRQKIPAAQYIHNLKKKERKKETAVHIAENEENTYTGTNASSKIKNNNLKKQKKKNKNVLLPTNK